MKIASMIVTRICLSSADGTNDNFKSAATLFGSGTIHYRRALIWATSTTLCGLFSAYFFRRIAGGVFSWKEPRGRSTGDELTVRYGCRFHRITAYEDWHDNF